MQILDFYPAQGSFAPGETVVFLTNLESATAQDAMLRIFIRHLAEQPVIIERRVSLVSGVQTIQMEWIPSPKPAGYFARLEVSTGSDTLDAATAFDVLENWTDFPRYGFLSDFGASRADPESVIQKLTRFHINGLQFYDWQYRHDELLAPTEEYIDPLGRPMSLVSVRKLVDAAHRHGMAAMPYLTIYAASAEFWHAHPEWALHDESDKPIAFGENFLGLMDPSAGTEWSRHLLDEGTRALQGIPFDGLHIDQYGDPKLAWNAQHQPVDLPQAFVDFIRSASNQHPDKTILFNAVGNWPIEALAESAADFMYIEIWPPKVEYRQLAEIVLHAVCLSHGKAVVIALYLPASRPANNLLADAVILACGGTRIELGENVRLLSDPYFPKHEETSSELQTELKRLYDFMVRNGECLRPYTFSLSEKEKWAEGKLNPDFISTDEAIWTVARNFPDATAIQVVNFSGINSRQRWDDAHTSPTPREDVAIKIHRSHVPAEVLWDCPEETQLVALDFEYSNGMLAFQIPQINYAGMVVIHD